MQINDEAGRLAVNKPVLLTQRGKLFELAREAVVQSGYQFKKGKSRSKKATSSPKSSKKPRSKVEAEVRHKRMAELQEDIQNLEDQLKFKVKRREEAETGRRYKVCEDITEEISTVQETKREKASELAAFQAKEKKAIWYKERKSSTQLRCTTGVTSDESEPLSSQTSSASGMSLTSESDLSSSANVMCTMSMTVVCLLFSPLIRRMLLYQIMVTISLFTTASL